MLRYHCHVYYPAVAQVITDPRSQIPEGFLLSARLNLLPAYRLFIIIVALLCPDYKILACGFTTIHHIFLFLVLPYNESTT